MNDTVFTLREGEEYIELYKLLKATSLCGTGGEAKMRIADGEALINGEVTTVKRLKIRPDMKVEFAGETLKVELQGFQKTEESEESEEPVVSQDVEDSLIEEV